MMMKPLYILSLFLLLLLTPHQSNSQSLFEKPESQIEQPPPAAVAQPSPGAPDTAATIIAATPAADDVAADVVAAKPTPTAGLLGFFRTCRGPYRTLDGTCNSRLNWGAANRRQSRFTRSNKKEGRRVSARVISNKVLHQGDNDIRNDRGMSEFVTFFGQLVDHTFASTPTIESERMDIRVPRRDKWFKGGKTLKFLKSQKFRGTPINSLSSFVDGSSIYGNSEERGKSLRVFKDGMMKVSGGGSGLGLLPKNLEGVENAPRKNAKGFFLAGDDRSNEHPMLTCLHTVFIREHNLIAKEVMEKNKGLSDEEIFQRARKINIGQFQKIVYKEFLPTMMGEGALKPYRGYKPYINPDVDLSFTTAAFRVGHTLVNDEVSRMGAGGERMRGISLKDAFFDPKIVEKNGVEVFLRAAAKTKTQEVDAKVVDGLRNFLFTTVEMQFPEVSGFDLAALNIQRGRDHLIGDYMGARKAYGLSTFRRWRDLTRNRRLRRALRRVYKRDINNVDAWVGGLIEKHKSGSSLGPLFHSSWKRSFERMRDADYYYYEKKGEFTNEEKKMYPRVKKLFDSNSKIMRDILIRATDITESELQQNVFRA